MLQFSETVVDRCRDSKLDQAKEHYLTVARALIFGHNTQASTTLSQIKQRSGETSRLYTGTSNRWYMYIAFAHSEKARSDSSE